MSFDERWDGADDEPRGMSIVEWETFRIRAVALEQAVRWASNWDARWKCHPSMLDEVLDVAEDFEAFLRGSVEDKSETQP